MRGTLFPPGGIPSRPGIPDDSQRRSHWNETQFMFRQLCRGICPDLSLSDVIRQWPSISHTLREAPRKRTRQNAKIRGIIQRELG